jgi:sortase (surface protein transpeptidase)
VLHVPRLGLTSTVKDGNAYAVTNSGYSWHWTGTGYVGQEAHVSVFGHRTEHGGPYRYIHVLQNGDTATLQTADGRLFTYRMVRRDLVWGASRSGPPTANILAATRQHPGTTLSLIACTRTDWLPTSLNHRIVVTFELVSWREV